MAQHVPQGVRVPPLGNWCSNSNRKGEFMIGFKYTISWYASSFHSYITPQSNAHTVESQASWRTLIQAGVHMDSLHTRSSNHEGLLQAYCNRLPETGNNNSGELITGNGNLPQSVVPIIVTWIKKETAEIKEVNTSQFWTKKLYDVPTTVSIPKLVWFWKLLKNFRHL